MLQKKMDKFFDPLRRYIQGDTTKRCSLPGTKGLLDWVETPKFHIFKLNVPGYWKNNVKVQLGERRLLTMKAEHRSRKGKDGKNSVIWHAAERGGNQAGEFSREIILPEDVNLEQIKARIKNDVLTVLAPKDSSTKPPPITKNVPIVLQTKKKVPRITSRL